MSAAAPTPRRMTVPDFRAAKQHGRRLTVLTAYDHLWASILDEAGVDALLVGDTLGMVVQGRESTLPVTLRDVLYHGEMVARAAQREPDLPLARLDGPDRELRLLVDHRESLVAERTRLICRLRWHLHELDPGWEPKARSLDAQRTLDEVQARLQQQLVLLPV